MRYPAERRPVDRFGQIGRAVAHDHIAIARTQMREEGVDVGDVFEHAEYGDESGGARCFGRELPGIEIADDGDGIACDEVAAAIAATYWQETLERHLATAKIEHTAPGRNELRRKLRTSVPRCLEGRGIGPAL